MFFLFCNHDNHWGMVGDEGGGCTLAGLVYSRVKVMCVCGGVAADVGSSSGGCGSRPADVSPDGTYGRALLPPSTIMSHIS